MSLYNVKYRMGIQNMDWELRNLFYDGEVDEDVWMKVYKGTKDIMDSALHYGIVCWVVINMKRTGEYAEE